MAGAGTAAVDGWVMLVMPSFPSADKN